MSGFYQAVARGLHPIRTRITQRQRLEMQIPTCLIQLPGYGPGAGRLGPARTLTESWAGNCIRMRKA